MPRSQRDSGHRLVGGEEIIDEVPPQGAAPSPAAGWVGVIAIAATAFVIVATEFAPTAVLTAVAAEFDVSLGDTGMMTAIPGLVAALTALLAMRIPSSIDRRIVLAAAGAITAVANVLVAVAPAFAVVLLGRVGAGIALGVFWTVGAATAVRLVGDERSVRAISIVSGGTSLGLVAGMPAGSLVGPPENWRVVFVAFAVAAVAVTLVLSALLPKLSAERNARSHGAPLSIWRVTSRPVIAWSLAAAFTVFVGQFASSTFLGAFIGASLVSPILVTGVLTAFGGVGILGMLVATFAFGRRPVVTVCGALALLVAAIGVVAVTSTVPSNATLVVVVALLWGTVWGAVPFGLQTWMLTRATENRETVSAALVIAIQLGIGTGSALGSVILRLTEHASAGEPAYTVIFIVSVAVCLVALTLFALGARGRRAMQR
ncbi:MFS transporter [Paramicrobacterium fandaimingii]|uniref:MFS transporter n=1 Tax=Paramicrobacterium fandaimingii TaxID=2708079 RepID=UPI0014223D12|nr:MFS transporter [Microbacterium fandaimingii]